MNALIHSYEQLRVFHKLLATLEPGEVHFVGLACRAKYMTMEERSQFSRSQDGVFARKLVAETSFNTYLRTLQQYELAEGWKATTTSGRDIQLPGTCLALYGSINPCSGVQAVKHFMQKMLDASFSNDPEVKNTMAHAHSTLLSMFQTSRSRKLWIDIDFDIPKEEFVVLKPFLGELRADIFRVVVETRGGYHVLIRCDEALKGTNLGALASKYELIAKQWYSENDKIEIKVGGTLIPIPGTLQAGFPVHIVAALSSAANQSR